MNPTGDSRTGALETSFRPADQLQTAMLADVSTSVDNLKGAFGSSPPSRYHASRVQR